MIEIREERPDDIAAVRDVNRRAFEQEQESNIVDALRTNGGALLSLVAAVNGRVVGHIIYSPLTVAENVNGVALGPMAVVPENQRCGLSIHHCCGPPGILSPIRIQTGARVWNQV